MIWLGIRNWKDKVALAAVDHTSSTPHVIFHDVRPAPAGLDDSRRSHWVFQTVSDTIDQTGADRVGINISAGTTDQQRAMFDGAAAAATGAKGLPSKLLRRTAMAKPLGIPGRGNSRLWTKYFKTNPMFQGLPASTRDAVAVALAAAQL